MTKLIPPNGCLFCELPKPSHGSRLDGLHPSGVWTWVEPSDRVRLQRMKRNRAIRKGYTMSMVGMKLDTLFPHEWVGQWVTYHGNRRQAEFGGGAAFKIVEKRDNNASVGFQVPGEPHLQWSAPWALKIAEAPEETKAEPMTVEQAEEILNPALKTVEDVRSEIKRLTQRLEELRITERVLSSL